MAEAEHDMSHSAAAPGPRATGPIAWMAKNPVAANLMMFFLLVGGLLSLIHISEPTRPY